MTDTIRVIPVLGEDGEPIMENGQIVVQNQADHALLSVSAEYLSDDPKSTFCDENKKDVNADEQQGNTENEQTVEPSEALTEKAVKFQWSRDTTKVFLRLFNAYDELKRSGKILKWKSIWIKISKELNSLGYNVDPTQVENKYKSLKRSYKYMLHHKERICGETKHINFEEEVISLFSKKPETELDDATLNKDDSISLSVSGECSDRDNAAQGDDDELKIELCDEGSDKPTKFAWSKRATKMLLQLYSTNRDLMHSGKISKWKTLWSKLSEEMNNHGYHVDPTQVENKYKSLKRAYKDMIQHNMKIGAQPKHIDFEKEIVALFEKKNGTTVLPSVKTPSFQSSKRKQLLPLPSVPGTLIAIPSKTPVRILQPNMIHNVSENVQFVGVQDFTNIHNVIFKEPNSDPEPGSSDNKSDKRIRLTATGRILQDTLEVFRETSSRRDVFQSEIGELYRKEVLHAQQFREESLKIKNRKLDLLEKFLEIKNEKNS